VYYFITARTLGSIFDSEPASLPSGEQDEINSPLLSDQNQLRPPEASIERGSLREDSPSIFLPPYLILPRLQRSRQNNRFTNSRLLNLCFNQNSPSGLMFIPALFINAELSQTSQSGVAAEIRRIAWKYSPDTKQFRRCKIEGARGVWASSSHSLRDGCQSCSSNFCSNPLKCDTINGPS